MHFGIGMVLGTTAGLPFLLHGGKQKASASSAKWLITAYITALAAVFPSLLGFLGVPESITGSWPMNLFLLHPFIDHLKSGGKLIGEVLVVSCFCLQYAIMMFLLRKCTEPRPESGYEETPANI